MAEARELVDKRVLIKLLPQSISDQTSSRDKFHVDLTALAGILHLFIGLGNVLRIR